MRSAVRTRRSWSLVALLPVVALLAVVALDAVQRSGPWPVPVVGLLDEPAHLLTAYLALACTGPARRWWGWVLAGAVLIDLDNLPLYLGAEGITGADGGRPVTHSLLTVGVLALVGLVLRPALGLALGVALHLCRDLATGPGVPLLWPVADGNVQVPYPAYLLALAVLTLMATAARGRLGSAQGYVAHRRH